MNPTPCQTSTPDHASPHSRAYTLMLILLAFFIGFYVCVNLIGPKLFSFTFFGIGPQHFGFLGDSTTFVATAGILAFPLVFILTDILNEYYGPRTVRFFTVLAVAVTVVLQIVVQAAAQVPTVMFDPLPAAFAGATADKNALAHGAFTLAFAGSLAVVVGSIMAFVLGQLLDVWVFTKLRNATGGKALWLRAQGSTLVSQLIDTFVVIYVAFVFVPMALGQEPWPNASAFMVSITNYTYKFIIALALTPLLYVVHIGIDAYLGKSQAQAMTDAAHRG